MPGAGTRLTGVSGRASQESEGIAMQPGIVTAPRAPAHRRGERTAGEVIVAGTGKQG